MRRQDATWRHSNVLMLLLSVPGDALFFHSNVLHTSDQNNSDMRRWAFLCSYNRRDNNPIIKHHHPQYTPLKKVQYPWWRHQMETFPRYWPFVQGIHRSPVNSPHKGQWRGALGFSLICAWIDGWVNNREGGDLRRHRSHYDVIVMPYHNRDTRVKWTRSFNLFRYYLVKASRMRTSWQAHAFCITVCEGNPFP